MKKIKLHGNAGAGKFALVDDEDFERINKYRWHFSGPYARCCIYLGGGRKNQKIRNILMHRIVMNTPEELHTDHINRNTIDNRKINLRICTPAENVRNSKKSKNNTSGFTGASWSKDKKKWVARIVFNYKQIIIGYFKNKREAAKAYDRKAIELFGEFARINFPKNAA